MFAQLEASPPSALDRPLRYRRRPQLVAQPRPGPRVVEVEDEPSSLQRRQIQVEVDCLAGLEGAGEEQDVAPAVRHGGVLLHMEAGAAVLASEVGGVPANGDE